MSIIDFFRRRDRPSDSEYSRDQFHARLLAEPDGLAVQAKRTLEQARSETPHAFDSRRDRRIGDRQAEGLEVNEYTNTDLIQVGNTDIACERGDAQPDTGANTLLVYPKASDLPMLERWK